MPANIDPTKLERLRFIGAGTGWYLANLAAADTDQLLGVLNRKRLVRTARMLGRSATLAQRRGGGTAAISLGVRTRAGGIGRAIRAR